MSGLFKSPKIPGPDPAIGQAALEQVELSREALDWYRDYAERVLEPAQRELEELNRRVVDQHMQIAGEQHAIARENEAYHRGTFRPVEQALADEAMQFNKADFADRQAAGAKADIEGAFGQVQSEVNRDLARRGVSQSADQVAANATQLALQKAAASAAAQNKARTDADAIGFARKTDVASLGRGIANQTSTAAQIALQGGSGASQAQQSTSAGAMQAGQFVGQGYNTAIGGIGSAGSLFAESSRQRQNAAIQQSQSGGELFGTLLGAGARLGSAYLMAPTVASDKKLKKNRKPAKPSAASQAIKDMPIEQWQYDEKKAPALADGREHVGPMAQDFAEHVGGDGKTINVGDAIGLVLASQKDTLKRLDRLEGNS